MMYYNRPQHEQEVIAKAYDFEVKAIEECDATRNPWHKEIMSWADGKAVWNAIDEALAEKYGEQPLFLSAPWVTATTRFLFYLGHLQNFAFHCARAGFFCYSRY